MHPAAALTAADPHPDERPEQRVIQIALLDYPSEERLGRLMRATPNQVRAVPGAHARARRDRNTDQGRRRHPGVLDEPLPRVGDRCLVPGGDGRPLAIVRTTDVRVGPLWSVDDCFAWDEGEGDRTRAWWLDAHTRFFSRQCTAMGLTFSGDTGVVSSGSSWSGRRSEPELGTPAKLMYQPVPERDPVFADQPRGGVPAAPACRQSLR